METPPDTDTHLAGVIKRLLVRVIAEGAAMAIGGLAVGLACGYGLAQLAGTFLGDLKMPDLLPVDLQGSCSAHTDRWQAPRQARPAPAAGKSYSW